MRERSPVEMLKAGGLGSIVGAGLKLLAPAAKATVKAAPTVAKATGKQVLKSSPGAIVGGYGGNQLTPEGASTSERIGNIVMGAGTGAVAQRAAFNPAVRKVVSHSLPGALAGGGAGFAALPKDMPWQQRVALGALAGGTSMNPALRGAMARRFGSKGLYGFDAATRPFQHAIIGSDVGGFGDVGKMVGDMMGADTSWMPDNMARKGALVGLATGTAHSGVGLKNPRAGYALQKYVNVPTQAMTGLGEGIVSPLTGAGRAFKGVASGKPWTFMAPSKSVAQTAGRMAGMAPVGAAAAVAPLALGHNYVQNQIGAAEQKAKDAIAEATKGVDIKGQISGALQDPEVQKTIKDVVAKSVGNPLDHVTGALAPIADWVLSKIGLDPSQYSAGQKALMVLGGGLGIGGALFGSPGTATAGGLMAAAPFLQQHVPWGSFFGQGGGPGGPGGGQPSDQVENPFVTGAQGGAASSGQGQVAMNELQKQQQANQAAEQMMLARQNAMRTHGGPKYASFALQQLAMGMKEEREHDDVTKGDPKKVKRIALAHLKEDPQYYTKLRMVMKR